MVESVSQSYQKLTCVGAIAAVRRRWTPDRCRLVWVNGCWDLLHAGHIQFLRQAASFGDVLVVGVNDDASVRQLKGRDRPVVPLRDRIDILLELECVDYVVPVADLTPVEAVRAIRPDVVVKSAQYAPSGDCICPEAEIAHEHGGRVEYMPLRTGISTTEIVRRIMASREGGGR